MITVTTTYNKYSPFAVFSRCLVTDLNNVFCFRAYVLTGWRLSHNCLIQSQSQSYVTADGQSTSLSWCQAPIWGPRSDFCYCQTVAGLLWGALSDERTGPSFIIAAGRRKRSHIYRLRTVAAILLHEF
jgi:hypothetical protein